MAKASDRRLSRDHIFDLVDNADRGLSLGVAMQDDIAYYSTRHDVGK